MAFVDERGDPKLRYHAVRLMVRAVGTDDLRTRWVATEYCDEPGVVEEFEAVRPLLPSELAGAREYDEAQVIAAAERAAVEKSAAGAGGAGQEGGGAAVPLPVLTLPEGLPVVVVDTLEAAQEACRVLAAADDVGIDCEWRPALSTFSSSRVALLQLGCDAGVYLFDMPSLADCGHMAAVNDALA